MKTLNNTEISQVTGGFFDIGPSFLNTPGWGSTIGGYIGSYTPIPGGAIIGSIIGHGIENTDYHKMGEDYKNQINDELKNGYIPAD